MDTVETPANTPAASRSASAGGVYSVARAHGKCQACGKDVLPGEKLMAALREAPAALERLDICFQCWQGFDHSNLLGYWRTTMPQPTARKKLFVDDDVLCDLFERLGDAVEPAKLNFRFVLGLVLMRKRRLIYESTRVDDGREIWTMRFRSSDTRLNLYNPRLDERQVAEVSTQLGEILSADV